jgi:hypothetical protein
VKPKGAGGANDANDGGRDAEADQHAHAALTTKEGWHRFVQAAPATPGLLPPRNGTS